MCNWILYTYIKLQYTWYILHTKHVLQRMICSMMKTNIYKQCPEDAEAAEFIIYKMSVTLLNSGSVLLFLLNIWSKSWIGILNDTEEAELSSKRQRDKGTTVCLNHSIIHTIKCVTSKTLYFQRIGPKLGKDKPLFNQSHYKNVSYTDKIIIGPLHSIWPWL